MEWLAVQSTTRFSPVELLVATEMISSITLMPYLKIFSMTEGSFLLLESVEDGSGFQTYEVEN